MAKRNYIPGPDAEFDIFQLVLLRNVQPKAAGWNIPPAAVNTLLTLQTKWTAAWKNASNKKMRTHLDVENKQEIRVVYEKAIRQFVNEWLTYNSKIKDSDRLGMSLTVRDTNPSVPSRIDSHPNLNILTPAPGLHRIVMLDSEETTLRGKPKGIIFCDLRWKVGDEQPVDEEDFTSYDTPTRTSYYLLHNNLAGQWVHYYARWVNRRNKKGPWSSVKSSIVR